MAKNRGKHAPTVDYTEPARTPEPVPPTDDEAVANLAAVFGPEDVKWSRQFDRHADFDGTPVWIDRATGQVFKTIPRLSSKDGTIL